MSGGHTSGQQGEMWAKQHYEADGYRLLFQNYRTRQGEIDLVLQKENILVFAEVKTRGVAAIAAPREWVDTRKQKRIILAAQAYLAQYICSEACVRFDVVEVQINASSPKIHRIENAFTV